MTPDLLKRCMETNELAKLKLRKSYEQLYQSVQLIEGAREQCQISRERMARRLAKDDDDRMIPS